MEPGTTGMPRRRWTGSRTAAGTVLVLALAGALPETADAQVILPPPGTRIRITLDDAERVVGALSGARHDTLLIRPELQEADRAVPLNTLQRLEVSRGIRPQTGRGALIGLLSGAAAGAVSGMVVCAGDNCVNSGEDLTTLVPVVLGIGGGAFGAGVGALIGAQFHGEHWTTLSGTRGRRMGMNLRREPGLRLAFRVRL